MVRVTELAPLEQALFRIIQGIEIAGLIHECIRSSKSPFLRPMGIYSCRRKAISMPKLTFFFFTIITASYDMMRPGGQSGSHFFSREVTKIAVAGSDRDPHPSEWSTFS
jgi:hypothetical protein